MAKKCHAYRQHHTIKTGNTTQAHWKISHVLTANTTGQVGSSAPSTVRLLQTLQNATYSHKNVMNTKMMAKT